MGPAPGNQNHPQDTKRVQVVQDLGPDLENSAVQFAPESLANVSKKDLKALAMDKLKVGLLEYPYAVCIKLTSGKAPSTSSSSSSVTSSAESDHALSPTPANTEFSLQLPQLSSEWVKLNLDPLSMTVSKNTWNGVVKNFMPWIVRLVNDGKASLNHYELCQFLHNSGGSTFFEVGIYDDYNGEHFLLALTSLPPFFKAISGSSSNEQVVK